MWLPEHRVHNAIGSMKLASRDANFILERRYQEPSNLPRLAMFATLHDQLRQNDTER
jgi:hypothetical protein